MTTPPPSIDISGSSDGGGDDGAASDGGGDDASPSAAPDVPAPDPADYPGMDENTPEGAVQAFRFYIATVYHAHSTGDSAPLAGMYKETCESCADLEQDIQELEQGGDLWTATTLVDAWSDPHESESFDVEVSYGFRLSTDGRSNGGGDRKESTAMTAIAGMDWEDGRWVVGGMQIGESEHG
ncbi:DUF6318 family protein [Brachybacterium paraconglomeratum]